MLFVVTLKHIHGEEGRNSDLLKWVDFMLKHTGNIVAQKPKESYCMWINLFPKAPVSLWYFKLHGIAEIQ